MEARKSEEIEKLVRDRKRMDTDIRRELEINQLIIKKKEIHNNQLKD